MKYLVLVLDINGQTVETFDNLDEAITFYHDMLKTPDTDAWIYEQKEDVQ